MLFSCESCPKGKQLTLNPRQDHMKITYHIYCELFSHIDHTYYVYYFIEPHKITHTILQINLYLQTDIYCFLSCKDIKCTYFVV